MVFLPFMAFLSILAGALSIKRRLGEGTSYSGFRSIDFRGMGLVVRQSLSRQQIRKRISQDAIVPAFDRDNRG